MADDKFKLPGSSYEELAKIITAYANLDKPATPAEVGNLAGKAGTEVSRNNGFLLAMGIVEGGPQGKQVTPLGRSLGRAILHQQEEDVVEAWRASCAQAEFVQKVLSAVRVRRGMDRSTLVSHILYTSGQKKTPQSTAGAGCLVDILLLAALLGEENGRLTATAPTLAAPILKEEPPPRVTTIETGDAAQLGPALTYYGGGRVFSTTASTPISAYTRVPFEIQLRLSVTCSPEDIPSLAPKIRQLIRDLEKPPEDESSTEAEESSTE